jgi:hypothetical protein
LLAQRVGRLESGKHPTPKYIGLAMAALALGIEPYGKKL